LGRNLRDIPVAEVIVAIDGPIALTSCVDGALGCESQSLCPVAGRWDPVNDAIRDALSGITLADMAAAIIPRAFRTPMPAPAEFLGEVV
jgi:DNA-binding IscR family transcriptional regulator